MAIYLAMLNLFLAGNLFYIGMQHMVQSKSVIWTSVFFTISAVNVYMGYKVIMAITAGGI